MTPEPDGPDGPVGPGRSNGSDGPDGYDCHRDGGPYAGVASFLTRIATERPRLAARHRVELH
ncbi:hypothetical protein ACFQ08_44510, partial [Streptosporangium algeriense]